MRISLLFRPILSSTQISWDNHEFRSTNFANFCIELENLLSSMVEACLFRGQRTADWLIDSTLARSIKKQRGLKVIQRYSNQDLADGRLQHDFARLWLNKFHTIVLSPELKQLEEQGLDPYFEYHRHAQQNPNDSLIRDFEPLGTNFIDFTYNWKIGLFFANRKRKKDEESALFIVRQKELGTVLYQSSKAVYEITRELEKWLEEKPSTMYGHLPLMIYPEKQLRNSNDAKPERQSAVYLVQTDFRCDLEYSWRNLTEESGNQVYAKFILPAGTQKDVEDYLKAEGLTEEFLFPTTVFDTKHE